MAQPEQPSSKPQEGSERDPAFGQTLNRFETTLGPQAGPLPAEITVEWLNTKISEMARDHHFDNYNEQSRYNELTYRLAALQRMNDFQQGGSRSPEKVGELVVANQAVAYHEYFRSAQNQLLTVLRRYETVRKDMSVVPPEILKMEADTQQYMSALDEATRERVVFSNVLLIDGQIERKFGDAAALQTLRQEYVQKLTSASRAALGAGNDLKLIRANQLNQRIIDILAGEHGLPGVERGYVPKKMFLALLKTRYKQLLDQQIEIARDPTLANAEAERDRLVLKHKLAEQGSGEFTAADKARYDEVQKRLQNVNGQYDVLKKQRGEATDQILALTQDLGEYNIAQTELSAIQEQLGRQYSFEGVMGLNADTTPADVRTAITENMEMRKAHHLGQMNNFLENVDEQVLGHGLKEHLEQFWNVNGREAVRIVTQRMARFFTFPVPESFGLREAAVEALTEPLDESLGWPAGKDRWDQLTTAEKQKVREKATSVLDLIERFDRTKITNLRESVILMQGMPPASKYVFDQVRFDESGQPILPHGRVTVANREALMTQYGGATVYLMIMRQMQGDFGSMQPAGGFMGEYARFLTGVNENIGTHVDVGRACNILSNRWKELMKLLLIAAGVLLIVGGIVAIVMWEGGKLVVKRLLGGGGKVVPSAGAAGAAAEGGAGVSTGEKVAEGAARSSRVGRVLGPIGIVLLAAELRSVINRDARLKPPEEYDGITAAIEFWEGHPSIDRSTSRYDRELRYLQKRLQCFVIEDGSTRLTQAIQKVKKLGDAALQQRAEKLQDRCEEIRMQARRQKLSYYRLFPLTDYFVVDPNRPAGNIGVSFRQLDEARQRSFKEEERQRRLEEFDAMDRLQKREGFKVLLEKREPALTRYEDLNEEYKKLLEDGAEILELLERRRGQ